MDAEKKGQADKPKTASDSGTSTPQPSKDKRPGPEFVLESLFPDPMAILGFCPKPLDKVKDEAQFVLDANVLLLPYTTGKDALDAIRTTYQTLVDSKRLVVPERAIREFAVHRLEKISQLCGEVNQWRRSLQEPNVHASPSLEALPSYAEYQNARKTIAQQIGKCRDVLDGIRLTLTDWYYNDPVLVIYRSLFSSETVVGPGMPEELLRQDNENRNLHGIPPGCSKEDAKKSDKGIGDKLIWHTILRIARERKSHVVFVTHDVTKGDWVHFHKEPHQVLFPRYELTEEFRRESGGKTLHIVELPTVLKLFGQKDEIVKAVQVAVQESECKHVWEDEYMLTNILQNYTSRSSRSFDWLRRKGIGLTDEQFVQIIGKYPDRFKIVRIVRRDKDGRRILPGKLGVAIQPFFKRLIAQ